MYNNPYEYFRQQNMNTMNLNQMDNMQNMGYQMPTMPMQPMQPMQPMGTIPDGSMGTTSGVMPTNIGSVPLAMDQFGETPVMDTDYTQGWLETQIGKRIKVEFLIGTNLLIDREGTLLEVGISYIIINEVETDDLLLCDIYSIKFVRVYL